MRCRDLLVALLAAVSVVAAPLQAPAVQAVTVDEAAANRDLSIAEFYRRTGNLGSAKFYYQLVQRRYPGSTHANNATQRLTDLGEGAK